MVRAKHVVTMCVYMNFWAFYGDEDPDAGFPEYDHIVTVETVESEFDDDLYHPEDIIILRDHGLYNENPEEPPPFLFSYTMGEIQATRSEANSPDAGVYSVPICDNGNFGIAHTGVLVIDDATAGLLPVRVVPSVQDELPEIQEGSQVRPRSSPLTLQVTVTLPEVVASPLSLCTQDDDDKGRSILYRLYEYTDVQKVPFDRFNAQWHVASRVWNITAADVCNETSGPAFTISVPIQSDNQRVYRALSADAP